MKDIPPFIRQVRRKRVVNEFYTMHGVYVATTFIDVRNLSFKICYHDIKINGKKVENLRDYIKEITFDNLYPTKVPFGSGTVDNITKV